MTNANAIQVQPKSLKTLLNADLTKDKFKEVLGKKAPGFIASILSVVNNNELLAKAEPKSVLNAAMIAATLDLPINSNLGFAYIIPYNDRKANSVIAQFQMGYKGFIQLAQRSGLFRTINVTDVREGEITSMNRLTGKIEWNWYDGEMIARDKMPVIGYVAYMELLNGFEKSLYMTVEQLSNHGLRYSQTMKKGFGLWKDDFDSMASKTVVKLLLSKYAPLTTQMQTAQLADQALIKEEGEYEYVDNKPLLPEEVAEDKERARIKKHIEGAKTISDLNKCAEVIDPEDGEIAELFKAKEEELQKGKK